MTFAAASQPPVSTEASRLDWPFLIAALLATALLVVVAIDGQPAYGAAISGFGLAAFLKANSYTASWRRFLSGQAGGLLGGLM
jgi:hypothetical protein